MNLSDYSPAKRRETVSLAATVVLARTAGELPTWKLAEIISKALGCHDNAAVGKVLVKLAQTHPAAKRSGLKFQRYGRTCERIVWSGAKPAKEDWSVSKPELPTMTPEEIEAELDRLGIKDD